MRKLTPLFLTERLQSKQTIKIDSVAQNPFLLAFCVFLSKEVINILVVNPAEGNFNGPKYASPILDNFLANINYFQSRLQNNKLSHDNFRSAQKS